MFALFARTRRIEMPADELDFAVSLTGYSNFLGSFILIFFSSSYDVLSTPRFRASGFGLPRPLATEPPELERSHAERREA